MDGAEQYVVNSLCWQWCITCLQDYAPLPAMTGLNWINILFWNRYNKIAFH